MAAFRREIPELCDIPLHPVTRHFHVITGGRPGYSFIRQASNEWEAEKLRREQVALAKLAYCVVSGPYAKLVI